MGLGNIPDGEGADIIPIQLIRIRQIVREPFGHPDLQFYFSAGKVITNSVPCSLLISTVPRNC
jgi:hypothetical protein